MGYLKHLAERKAKEECAEKGAQLDQELKKKQLSHLKFYKAVSIISVAVALISVLITWSTVSDDKTIDKKIETLEDHIKQMDSAIKHLKGD